MVKTLLIILAALVIVALMASPAMLQEIFKWGQVLFDALIA